MNRENLKQDLKQLKAEISRNARECMEFGCSATPAPTPPGTDRSTRKAVVGAGLLYSRIQVGAGVKMKIRIKNKVESQKQSQNKHREKPPVVSLKGLAGFFTLFPEGCPPFGGPFFYLTFSQGGRP